MIGKTGDRDHFSPDNIDHLKPELIPRCIDKYKDDKMAGGMWSIGSEFALKIG